MLGFGPTPFVILLASVLKPVNDTRMRGKFAATLTERPYTRVHVAGRAPAGLSDGSTDEIPGVHLHRLFDGSRLSLARLGAQWRYWQLLQRLRPHLVVVHAPELLPLTLLWLRLGRSRRFIYDIRENYALNVATQQVYRGWLRRALMAGLAWVETRAARRAAGLILAEASYIDELPYLAKQPPGRVVVLENKYQPAPGETLPTQGKPLPPPHETLRLLYSGTISELNGIWEALALTEKLHHSWPGGACLTVIGFCQQPGLLVRLQAEAARHPEWLRVVGGAKAVPHAAIVAEIRRSHVGLLAYRPHPSTARCRPTKLFEYLAQGLPILAAPNALWMSEIARHQAGLELDFSHLPSAAELRAALQGHLFYPYGSPADALWAGEGKKLWHLLDAVI